MEITAESIHNQIPFYLTQEAKQNLSKELARFPKNINYYTNYFKDEILQGDGWGCFELFDFDKGSPRSVKGLLISNSCDISESNIREMPVKLSFVPIIRLSRYEHILRQAISDHERVNAKISAIKNQDVTSVFYLPQGGELTEDYIALLSEAHTVSYARFKSNNSNSKLFTLSQIGFYLFLFKLSVHFCRFHEKVDRNQNIVY